VNKYQKKQFKISLVYLLILVIIGLGVYLLIKPKLSTCSDGIQNQGEAGIDCGGPCSLCPWQLQEDLEINLIQAIKTQNNYVDLVAEVKNPNRDFGAESFSYIFNLYDFQENLIFSKKGVSYILPQETKYIIEQKVLINSKIYRIELKTDNITWQKLVNYEEPELLIRGQNFNQSEDFTGVIGTLENRSDYDFNAINIWTILLDKESNILGAGKIELKTILSKENRYFEISWPFSILGQVEKVNIAAKTNIFLDENFMKRHGGNREKFQEY